MPPEEVSNWACDHGLNLWHLFWLRYLRNAEFHLEVAPFAKLYKERPTFNIGSSLSNPVNQAGDVGSAEAVINVYHRDITRTAVQHAE